MQLWVWALRLASYGETALGKKLCRHLGYEVTNKDLEQMFEPHGKVESATVIADRDTGRSKGFGFAEVASRKLKQRRRPSAARKQTGER